MEKKFETKHLKSIFISLKLCISIVLGMFTCSYSYSQEKIGKGTVNKSDYKSIKLNPHQKNTIYLSDIVKSMDVKFLQSTDECLISDIKTLFTYSDNYFLNSGDNLVYMIDASGNFIRQIGQRGNGPGEIAHPSGNFAINADTKEIWIDCNSGQMYIFDLNGNFKRNFRRKAFCADFRIANEGFIYYNVSKHYNFSNTGEPIPFNFWIENPQGNLTTYFPYDPEIYPNGGASLLITNPFSNYKDKLYYTYTISDTVYSVVNSQVNAAYVIDFGEKKISRDLNKIMWADLFTFLMTHHDKAFFVQDFMEVDSHMRFKYIMLSREYEDHMKTHHAFIDKRNNKIIEGVMINDILGGEIYFKTQSGNKLIGYMNAFDIDLKAKASSFFDKNKLEKLKKVDAEDNPVIIEIELKEFK